MSSNLILNSTLHFARMNDCNLLDQVDFGFGCGIRYLCPIFLSSSSVEGKIYTYLISLSFDSNRV